MIQGTNCDLLFKFGFKPCRIGEVVMKNVKNGKTSIKFTFDTYSISFHMISKTQTNYQIILELWGARIKFGFKPCRIGEVVMKNVKIVKITIKFTFNTYSISFHMISKNQTNYQINLELWGARIKFGFKPCRIGEVVMKNVKIVKTLNMQEGVRGMSVRYANFFRIFFYEMILGTNWDLLFKFGSIPLRIGEVVMKNVKGKVRGGEGGTPARGGGIHFHFCDMRISSGFFSMKWFKVSIGTYCSNLDRFRVELVKWWSVSFFYFWAVSTSLSLTLMRDLKRCSLQFSEAIFFCNIKTTKKFSNDLLGCIITIFSLEVEFSKTNSNRLVALNYSGLSL